MTEPKKSKKKTIKEAIPIAKKIEKSVVKATKPSEAVAVPIKARSKEVPVVIANGKRPPQTMRVKAIANTRGVCVDYRYEIIKGEVYTFPDYVAKFLIEQNKAF
jgi:hypothetical protein